MDTNTYGNVCLHQQLEAPTHSPLARHPSTKQAPTSLLHSPQPYYNNGASIRCKRFLSSFSAYASSTIVLNVQEHQITVCLARSMPSLHSTPFYFPQSANKRPNHFFYKFPVQKIPLHTAHQKLIRNFAFKVRKVATPSSTTHVGTLGRRAPTSLARTHMLATAILASCHHTITHCSKFYFTKI